MILALCFGDLQLIENETDEDRVYEDFSIAGRTLLVLSENG